MVATTTILFPSDLLSPVRPLRQSSFGSTHSRHSFGKDETTTSPKKRVRFLCTDELDLSDSNSDSSCSQDDLGTIKERVQEFEKIDSSYHCDIWYTGDEIYEFRADIRRTAAAFGADYPIYGELLEYVLQNGHNIESEEIDIERMRARRRRKNPFAVSLQWLSISEDIEDERYDEDEEAEDHFESCDDDEPDECDYFPCMRGLENRVIPAFRQRRRWAVRQVLSLQNELSNRSYEQMSTGMRIQSLQVGKKATCYANHQGFLDAREAAIIHGL